MNIETIRDDVRHVVAKAGFLSADEVTDAVFDLIRAELTGDDTAEALAHWMAADFALRSGKYVDWRYLDYSSRSILGALAEKLVGK